MIDLHCHVLPGIDDGPGSAERARALARAAHAAGVRTLVATPHVSWHFQNRAERIGALAEELRGQLAQDGVALELRTGAEIAATYLEELDEQELAGLSLGGGGWLLVEPPFAPVVPGLRDTLAGLGRRGHRVLLAHPERCAAFHHDPDMLREIVRDGALTSVTAGSLVGRFGGLPRRFAMTLMEEGLAHNVASDFHDMPDRDPSIAPELEQAGVTALACWLTEEVPAAILAGGEIPPRPHVGQLGPHQHRRWRLRRA